MTAKYGKTISTLYQTCGTNRHISETHLEYIEATVGERPYQGWMDGGIILDDEMAWQVDGKTDFLSSKYHATKSMVYSSTFF